MRDLEYVSSDIWGCSRDASLWLDVPRRMLRLGLKVSNRAARQRFGRRAIRELQRSVEGVGLIVARVDGIGARS